MTPLEALATLSGLAEDPLVPVLSPCISVCRMDDASRLCIGCFRTIDEIIDWGRLPEPDRRRVWQSIRWRARIGDRSLGSTA